MDRSSPTGMIGTDVRVLGPLSQYSPATNTTGRCKCHARVRISTLSGMAKTTRICQTIESFPSTEHGRRRSVWPRLHHSARVECAVLAVRIVRLCCSSTSASATADADVSAGVSANTHCCPTRTDPCPSRARTSGFPRLAVTHMCRVRAGLTCSEESLSKTKGIMPTCDLGDTR